MLVMEGFWQWTCSEKSCCYSTNCKYQSLQVLFTGHFI